MASMAMGFFSSVGNAALTTATSIVPSILSGAMTVGSAMMERQQARAQAADLNLQAQATSLEGSRRMLETRQKIDANKREALKRVARNRVAFAASGLSGNSNQLLSLETDIDNETAYANRMEHLNGRMGQSASNLSASRYRAQASNVMEAAKWRQTATIGRGLLDIVKRG